MNWLKRVKMEAAVWVAAVIILMVFLECGVLRKTFAQSVDTSPWETAVETEAGSVPIPETSAPVEQKAVFKPYWKVKNGKYYYKTQEKKWASGITNIDGKKYYFDKKHIQRTGWQKIGKAYYFFRIGAGKKGSMVCSAKINQIKLGKNGKAKVTQENKKRLRVLVWSQKVVEKATKKNPSMKKKEKLKATWDYFLKNWRYVESPDFKYTKGWEVRNAFWCLDMERGDCMAQGAAFAFLANACGYEGCCAVSSGGHGWAEVNGRICDPTWAKVDKKNNYFMMKMSLSGKNRRPRYKTNRKHVYKI